MSQARDTVRYAQRPFSLPLGATEIILVRHGASAHVTPGQLFPRTDDGWGDPALAPIERLLAAQPAITVPAVTLVGSADGVAGSDTSPPRAGRFTGQHVHRVVEGVGHNLPQEAPQAFAQAVLEVDGWI